MQNPEEKISRKRIHNSLYAENISKNEESHEVKALEEEIKHALGDYSALLRSKNKTLRFGNKKSTIFLKKSLN